MSGKCWLVTVLVSLSSCPPPVQVLRTDLTQRCRTYPGRWTPVRQARDPTPASTSAGTELPAWLSWTTRRRWRTSYQDIFSGSSKTPTDGRNFGWSSLTSVSTSTKHFKMTSLWPAYLCWDTTWPLRTQVIISVRTTSSNCSSRTTCISSERRASSLLTGW